MAFENRIRRSLPVCAARWVKVNLESSDTLGPSQFALDSFTFLPIICEKQREPRKPSFARIERLINYVFLDPAVPAQ
jgi:hypothetical protein